MKAGVFDRLFRKSPPRAERDAPFTWRQTFERDDNVFAVTNLGAIVQLGDSLLRQMNAIRGGRFSRGQLVINNELSLVEFATSTDELDVIILDGASNVLGLLDRPSEVVARKLAAAVAPFFTDLLFRPITPDRVTQTLLQLSESTRSKLAKLLAKSEVLAAPTNIISLDRLGKTELDPVLSKGGILALFKVDWDAKAIDSIQRCRMTAPSHTKEKAYLETSIPVGAKDFVIKSISGDGVVCLLFVYSWYGVNGLLGMHFPAQGVSIIPKGRSWLTDYPERHRNLSASAIECLTAALPYLAYPPKRVGVGVLSRTLKGNHLGHTLWNVFSGLVRAVDASAQSTTRPWFYDMPAAAGQEIYGPTVNFFPELEDHVRVNASTPREAYIDACRNGRMLLPFVSKEIPQNLRERMVRGFAADPACGHLHSVSKRLFADAGSAESPLVIAFGLRLQNRTIPDLGDFYATIALKLRSKTGRKVILVIDGMNSVRSVVRGFSDEMITREHEFVEKLEADLGPDFTVVSCVGSRMSENIFYLKKAAFFVAPHGGGLTKYRWILNIPGYILTSPQNIKFSRWLKIYDSNHGAPDQWGNFENPSPAFYTNEDEAEDIILPGQEVRDGRLQGRWNGTLSPNNFRLLDLDASAERVSELCIDIIEGRTQVVTDAQVQPAASEAAEA